MSKEKKQNSNKEARIQIADQLIVSLPGLIELLGQEEFDKRAKKAAKILAEGIRVRSKKEKVKEPETGKAA